MCSGGEEGVANQLPHPASNLLKNPHNSPIIVARGNSRQAVQHHPHKFLLRKSSSAPPEGVHKSPLRNVCRTSQYATHRAPERQLVGPAHSL